jgi:hypothetical protein
VRNNDSEYYKQLKLLDLVSHNSIVMIALVCDIFRIINFRLFKIKACLIIVVLKDQRV